MAKSKSAGSGFKCPDCGKDIEVGSLIISADGNEVVCENCNAAVMIIRKDDRFVITIEDHSQPEKKESFKQSSGSTSAWIVTFADLATLLLTFFVLLLSFSNMDIIKYRELVGSTAKQFGATLDERGEYKAVVEDIKTDDDKEADRQSRKNRAKARLVNSVSDMVERGNYQKDANITITEDGVRIRLAGRSIFKDGSADINDKIKQFLDNIYILMQGNTNITLTIEGHTTNQETGSDIYPSNWELSASRASRALAYIVEKYNFPTEKVSAKGLADTQPLFPNEKPETRILNNRVEFLFKVK